MGMGISICAKPRAFVGFYIGSCDDADKRVSDTTLDKYFLGFLSSGVA
jgi:hypothetical protein